MSWRELAELARERSRHGEWLELLFWPALLAYGEAAVAYSAGALHGLGRLATWGVRLGWLAADGAARRPGRSRRRLPVDTWAGSLNLFVWLVVGAYLVWGCRPRYRLLGLAVMPLAAVLFLVAAYSAAATDAGERGRYSNLFLALHVGLVLAAFAGFTLAAALAGLYLWRGAAAASGTRPGILRLARRRS